ncbi:protein ORF2 [Pigeon adenovirus 1]
MSSLSSSSSSSAYDNSWERLVQSLVDRGIASTNEWYRLDPSQYTYYSRVRYRGLRPRDIVREAAALMSWQKCLYDYALLPATTGALVANPVATLLRVNGYDPGETGAYLVRWMQHRSPRNTVWCRGALCTGAHSLAYALSHLGPLRGVADCHDPENPFWSCTNKLVVWWENGYPRESNLALCKQVFGGENVILPRRPWEMFRTPVVAYTDGDLCRVRDRTGRFMREEYDGLRDLFFLLDLHVTLPPGQEYVSTYDLRHFLTFVVRELGVE